MGKNKSKRKPRTEFQKWESIMRKLDNELEKEEKLERIKQKVKERK